MRRPVGVLASALVLSKAFSLAIARAARTKPTVRCGANCRDLERTIRRPTCTLAMGPLLAVALAVAQWASVQTVSQRAPACTWRSAHPGRARGVLRVEVHVAQHPRASPDRHHQQRDGSLRARRARRARAAERLRRAPRRCGGTSWFRRGRAVRHSSRWHRRTRCAAVPNRSCRRGRGAPLL